MIHESEIPLPKAGVVGDLDQKDVPLGALSAAENWVIRDGVFSTRPGWNMLAGQSTGQRALGFTYYVHSDGFIRVVQGTVLGWWSWNNSSRQWVNITGTALTAGPTNDQVFRVFVKGGISYLIGINGTDTMKKWDGSAATYLDALGAPPKAVAMAVVGNHVLLGNLISGPTINSSGIDVSASLDFEAGWNGATLTAILGDTPGPITAMTEFGNLQSVVYKTDAIYIATAIDGTDPFRFDMKQPNIFGPPSPLCVAHIADGLDIFLSGDGDLKQFDGIHATTIDRKFQKRITDTIDFPSIKSSWLAYEPHRNELWVMYPESGQTEINIGFVVDLSTMAMWPMRLDTLRPSAGADARLPQDPRFQDVMGQFQTQTKTFSQMVGGFGLGILIADKGGQTFIDSGDQDNGANLNSFWETGFNPALPGQQGRLITFDTVHEVQHLMQQSPGSTVTTKVGVSANGEAKTYFTGLPINLSNPGPYKVGIRQTSRLLSLRLEATSKNQIVWRGAIARTSERGIR